MAYNSKAKVKVLFLLKILQEETDAEHGLTMAQIIERLAEYGISAERKSIYADIKALREFDVDVRTYQRNPVEYGIERRDFSLPELMLLVDAVQSCRTITEQQARMLTTNIKQLANNREQMLLDRQIHVHGRIGSGSESVLGLVDKVHDAIRLRCRMEFAYRRIGADGRPFETRDGKTHDVTPIAVSYDEGFYYLTAWNERHESIAEYRLDRMTRVRLLNEAPATRNSEIAAAKTRQEDDAVAFGRFKQEGTKRTVTLIAHAGKAGVIADRFGKKARFLPPEGDMARARVNVYVSEQFFGWVAGMGKAVRIESPESVVEEYRAFLRNLLKD